MFLLVDAADASSLVITGRFQVLGNFAETAHRIMGAEMLYRIGLSSFLVGSVFTVLLAMGLYGTLKRIGKNLALLALLFRLVEAALFGVQSIANFVVLGLYDGSDSMNAFDAKQLAVLTNLSSAAGSTGFDVAAIFFSIGSILFFYLFLKSNYIPKALSALGLVGSVLVTMVCFASLVLPQYAGALQFGWLPVAISEILVGLWLLIKGINLRPRDSGTPDLVAARSAR
jgi:hypothetical protein